MSEFAELERRIPGLYVTHAEGPFPFQAEGYYDRWTFFLRVKNGRTRIAIGSNFTAPLYEVLVPTPDTFDDTASWFMQTTLSLFPKLKRAQRVWYFEAVSARDERTGELARIGVHGDTPEHAFAQISDPDDFVLWRYGNERQEWITRLGQIEYKPQTVTVEDRIWPEVDPDFQVLLA